MAIETLAQMNGILGVAMLLAVVLRPGMLMSDPGALMRGLTAQALMGHEDWQMMVLSGHIVQAHCLLRRCASLTYSIQTLQFVAG